MKRNDIVVETDEKAAGAPWTPYGRVNKVIDETHVEVIDCFRDITVYDVKDLKVVENYKGRFDNGHLRRMPSLRKLKQMAFCYHPDVWKKKGKSRRVLARD